MNKKELTIDFEQYCTEKKETFDKGCTHGFEYCIQFLTVYLTKKIHIREMKNQNYPSNFSVLMGALGKSEEWEEFQQELEENTEEKQDEQLNDNNESTTN